MALRFPKQDELVMVQVRAIEEMGAYVTLLEYGNIEGKGFLLKPSFQLSTVPCRHDSAFRALPQTNPIHPKTHPCRPKRSGGGNACG